MTIINQNTLNKAAQLYQDEKRPLWDICKILNIKYNDLRPQLKQIITLRRSGEVMRITDPAKENLIIQDYENDVSMRNLAIKYNVDRSVILRVLREKKINKKTISESNRKKVIDHHEIIDLYSRGLSMRKIAKILKLADLTVFRSLHKNAVPINHAKPKGKRRSSIFDPFKDQIISDYNNEHFSCVDLANKYKTSHCVISNFLKKNGVTIRSGRLQNTFYKLNEDYFNYDSIHYAEKYFLLGLLFTDGCNKNTDGKHCVSLELNSLDKHVVDFFNDSIESNRKLSYIINKNTYKIGICNQKMSIDLEKLGCVPNKTKILIFPDWVKDNLFNHFLHGCIIGDGYVGSSSSSNNFSVNLLGTHNLIAGVKDKLNKLLNVNGSAKIHKESTFLTNLCYGGTNQVLKICNFIFKDAPFIMVRKYLKYEALINYKSSLTCFQTPEEIELLKNAKLIQTDIRTRFGNLIKTWQKENPNYK